MTGAPASSAEFVRLLEVAGAQVSSLPLIRIGPAPDEAALQDSINRADTFDWVAFTSAAGVEAFARRRGQKLDAQMRIAAVGPATQKAVHEHLDMATEDLPAQFSSSALADTIKERAKPTDSILVVTARDASPVLVEKLRAAGFAVEKADAYTTVEVIPNDLPAHVAACDVITLASPSAVRALVHGLGADAAARLRGKLVACIGPVTLGEARQLGLHVEVVPADASLAAIVDALCRYYTHSS